MSTKDERSESTVTSVPLPAHSRQYVSHWRTAEERAEALQAKKKRRRAAHRIALRRSHANG
jgi:hypothetical protein